MLEMKQDQNNLKTPRKFPGVFHELANTTSASYVQLLLTFLFVSIMFHPPFLNPKEKRQKKVDGRRTNWSFSLINEELQKKNEELQKKSDELLLPQIKIFE